ncbi:membrane associated histidine-rich protein [Plasmodium sp. gorilla clade G3]|nr:membrane associated histidine-rich protein [Plasmodium sp. gorilla clade G3]
MAQQAPVQAEGVPTVGASAEAGVPHEGMDVPFGFFDKDTLKKLMFIFMRDVDNYARNWFTNFMNSHDDDDSGDNDGKHGYMLHHRKTWFEHFKASLSEALDGKNSVFLLLFLFFGFVFCLLYHAFLYHSIKSEHKAKKLQLEQEENDDEYHHHHHHHHGPPFYPFFDPEYDHEHEHIHDHGHGHGHEHGHEHGGHECTCKNKGHKKPGELCDCQKAKLEKQK